MRKPHPRFDARRNAWVTNAGGKLKILAAGPKTAWTESAAWTAFYGHMLRLGRPLKQFRSSISVGELADQYDEWMQKEVARGAMRPKTRDYYVRFVQSFLDAVGGRRPARSILPIELERFKTGWHSIQTIQRLYNWGVDMGLLRKNQFKKKVERPKLGARQRILSPTEVAKLLRAADAPFRRFLLAMRHTIARPQEIRALQWKHLRTAPVPMFVLTEFKAKGLRHDGEEERRIVVDDRLYRLLLRLVRFRQPAPDDFVFCNRHGKPWSANAVRCRMRRLRQAVGLGEDERGEKVVTYTLRHTGATRATINGVRDRILADLLGHTTTQTTRRYQHVPAEPLRNAVNQATRRRA